MNHSSSGTAADSMADATHVRAFLQQAVDLTALRHDGGLPQLRGHAGQGG